MRNAAVKIASNTTDEAGQERRVPEPLEEEDTGVRRRASTLQWPMSWPAALYRGDEGAECRVNLFSAAGAHLTMSEPPPAGAQVALKFPFTVYLTGRVVWGRGSDLELEFDEESRRSARLVEDVLLNRAAAC